MPGDQGPRPVEAARRIYGKRFSCEETFDDIKDVHFGMGLEWTRIGKPERRDRLMFLAALAIRLLTLLGEAGEKAGLDRLLKTNSSKKRTMSLLRQGVRWYELIPTTKAERLLVLRAALDEVLQDNPVVHALIGRPPK